MKRLADIFLSLLGMVLLAPVVLVVAIAIRIKLGSPVIFSQERIGRREAAFKILKFRTMKPRSVENPGTDTDKDRLTPFGSWLRSCSLDELPELWNVLIGDMSLVGPRPLLPEYLPLYSDEQRQRHNVRPGITGWAQVNGRNSLSWKERFELDVWYVHNASLWLDLRILFMTVFAVFKRRGIAEDGEATMTPFRGNK